MANVEKDFGKGKPIYVGIDVHKRDWVVTVVCHAEEVHHATVVPEPAPRLLPKQNVYLVNKEPQSDRHHNAICDCNRAFAKIWNLGGHGGRCVPNGWELSRGQRFYLRRPLSYLAS